MKRKFILILFLILFIVIAISAYLLLFRPFNAKHYSFNDEIRAFPIKETSMTFTDWTIESASDGSDDIVTVKFTVRNINDSNIITTSFMLSEAPTLMYGDNYYSSATYYPEWSWQLYLPFPSFLLPNQAVNGYLKYEITKGTQPKQLLILDKDSPKIIIDFS